MARKKPSEFPPEPLDLFSEHRHGHIDRRSFLFLRTGWIPGRTSPLI